MTNTTNRNSDKFMLRMPDGMRDRIKAAAESNNRSMNAEIVAVLEREYPAPIRSLNFERYRAHQEYVEARSKEILAEINELTAQFPGAGVRLETLQQKTEALFKEHEKLWDFDIDDDQFHDVEPNGT